MSSHHIVREKQEPALLILGLDDFEDEWLGQLLEWSPTLIVTALTAEKINTLGIKYDVLVALQGDTADTQSDIKIIASGRDTELQAALKYLIANSYPAVNIITDQLSLGDYVLYAAEINIVIFYQGQKIYPVKSGFSKWKAACELIELKSRASGLQLTGIEKVDEQIYKTVANGFFRITFDDDCIFIAENLI